MLLDVNSRPVPVAVYIGAPQTISLSVASASVTLLAKKVYRLWSSVDSFFLLGGIGVVANTSSHPLKGGLDVLLLTDSINTTIAGVVSAGTGALFISQLDPVSN